METSRSGLFWLQKTQTLQDEEVDGEYGLIVNGHSLVSAGTFQPDSRSGWTLTVPAAFRPLRWTTARWSC